MFYERPEKQSRAPAGARRAKPKPKRPAKAKRGTGSERMTGRRAVPKNRRSSRREAPRRSVYRVSEPRRRKKHLLLRFIAILLILAAAAAVLLYELPLSALGPHEASALGSGYTHILLIGIDINAEGSSRSDTMMIASIGKDEVCLTSLQRDTGVYIPGRSGLNRLNAAYNYGGPELLMQTINLNFGLDLSMYALVDYDSFPELIDILGGVDIAGISNEEIAQLNHNMYDVLRRRYDAGKMSYDEASEEYRREFLMQGGDLHLDGLQALGYARIRKTDSDYTRTLRQRKVITAALKALKSTRNPITLIRLATQGIRSVETNLTTAELLSLGEKLLLDSSGAVRQTRLPVNGTYTDKGSMFYNVDYDKNHDAFIKFVYQGG